MADADPPPRRRSRSRSRSPPRRPKASGGFKWKEKRPTTSEDSRDGGGRDSSDKNLQRGYRDRSPRRDRDRDDRRDRDRDSNNDRSRQNRSPTRRDRDSAAAPRERDATRDRRRSPRRERSPRRDRPRDKPREEKKEKPRQPTAPQEEMIVVTVNDRLGTKAQIPAFPSDTVGQFKIMVAMKVGREPHEILLKRQGERPFKDHITLGDYGVSNGVQVDLEVDTGD
ncbi:ubiquitin-like modifier hub1 [Podospora pseudopauciseta]|uniref:Ubiquitin-like modifier HUB1 n=2 Tax=Podospora TaxID=5144 RepID=A0ABR0H3M1_9PEZI|nr:ubiquitin-like modifier hub1 [Podospora pseudopauciseta]KAK4670921.1 ubiquitin-like modifier hub1 [Podospora pseudoanserina]